MWILKNSKELLDNLQSHSLTSIHSIKHMIFRPFYTLSAYFTLFYRSVHVLNTGTTIPHTKLKARLSELIKNAFKRKNGKKRYEYIVVGYNSTYFVKNTSNAKNKYPEDDIVRMLDFLIDNIFIECGGVIFQQEIGIPMVTNCAPLLADLFLVTLNESV